MSELNDWHERLRPPKSDSVGVVLAFRGMTEGEVKNLLRSKGITDKADRVTISEYNSDCGDPVFYIP